MSLSYNLPEYNINVIKQSAFDTGATGGTLTEGMPYEIGDVKCPEVFLGTTAPTTSTTCSNVGDFYIAVISNNIRVWQCTAINGNTYTWRELIRDVQINGTSVLDTTTKVANIPIASSSNLGVVKANISYGIEINEHGILAILKATDGDLTSKSSNHRPIVPANLNKAVMEGLGNNSLTWTDAYKTSARNTIGAGTPVTIEFLDEDE